MLRLNGTDLVLKKYANGEMELKDKFIDSLNIKDGINKLIWYYRGDGDLIELLFVKRYLDELGVKVTLHITYLPYSRMDRTEGKYPFTLKYVCEYIKDFLKFEDIEVSECHSDVGLELLNAKQILTNEILLEDVKKEIGFIDGQDVIVYPDKGAAHRYESLGKGIICDKVRDFQTGKITSLEIRDTSEIKKGSKALILDDLCSYGGTFIKAAKALRDNGIEEVYLLVTHSENNIFEGEVLKSGMINKVFTTDSILTEDKEWSNAKYKENLKVYNIERENFRGKIK